jgi:MFS family permease
MVLEGIFNGIWQLNDVVARKTLHADRLWVTLLLMAPSVSMLLAMFVGPSLEGRDKRPFFLWAGILGRGLLLFAAGVREPWAFVALMGTSALTWAFLFPLQNAVYQSNYMPAERGRLFGIGSSVAGLFSVMTALAVGWLYDWKPGAYRWVYPAAALAGVGTCWMFSRVHQKGLWKRGRSEIRNPLRHAWEILRDDRDFRLFEVGFFLYGMAFMMMAPLIPLYLVDELKASYSQASFCKVVLYQSMLVLTSWVWGRFSGWLHPSGVGALTFAGLALFPVLLGLASTPSAAYGAFLAFGLCMAGVEVAWVMGPIAYAGGRDSSSYMAVHTALAGARALLGHPLGTVLLVLTGGYAVPFAVASSFFAIASGVMAVLWVRRRRGEKG